MINTLFCGGCLGSCSIIFYHLLHIDPTLTCFFCLSTVQYMIYTNNWDHYVLRVVFESHYHHYVDLPESNEHITCMQGTFCPEYVYDSSNYRSCHNRGAMLPTYPFLIWNMSIFVLHLSIFEAEIWITSHCLGSVMKQRLFDRIVWLHCLVVLSDCIAIGSDNGFWQVRLQATICISADLFWNN